MKNTTCPDCGAEVLDFDGPIHVYMGPNAGCWKLYGELLEKEYSNPLYMRAHRYTVDAYAAQHPGKLDRRAAQSVNIHLMALYLLLEKTAPFDFVTAALGRIVEMKKHKFEWLNPPNNLGKITIVDVLSAKTPNEHFINARNWGESVWLAWKPHHTTIARLAQKIL